MLAACGSSRRAQPYSGCVYSVGQVQSAFAALGVWLHTDSRHPGLTVLVNNHHLGQPYMGVVPRLLTVVVADRRHATTSPASLRKRGRSRLARYANVTVFYQPAILDEVRGSISTLRWGTSQAKPGRQLIVPGGSIGGIRLGESRKDVEKAFGPGRSMRHGLIRSYFGGHVLLTYDFHDASTKRVEGLWTRWAGFHTRSGVHVGSSRQALRPIYATCDKTACHLLEGPWPDALATSFAMRNGKVAEIGIGYS
jgi:hypothetical protein